MSLELEADYRRTDSTDSEHEELVFSEGLAAAVEGYLYHPRFLTFQADAGATVSHADIVGDGHGVQTALLPVYGVALNILPQHRFPIRLFARREEGRGLVSTTAVSALAESRIEEYGGEIALRLAPFNGRLSFRRSDLESDSLFVMRTEVRDTLRASFDHQPQRTTWTRIRFQRDDVREQPTGRDYRVTTASLENTLEVGQDAHNATAQFVTSLSYWDRARDFASESFRASESIRIRLSENLGSETRYAYRQTNDVFRSDGHSVTQTLSHRLFESLRTTVSGGFSSESVDGLNLETGGGSLTLEYRKRTAAGPLSVLYQFSFERQDNSVGASTLRAVDERHTLSTSSLTLLGQPDVVAGSVIVTSESRVFVYTEGVDYELVARGRRTELARLPGSAILDGATVLVTYMYASPANIRFDSFEQRLRVGIRLLDAIDLYAEYERLRQNLLQGNIDAASALEDADIWRTGVQVGTGGVRLLAEYMDHDSSSGPYEEGRVEIGYSSSVGRYTRAGVGLTHMATFFDSGGDLTVSTALATLNVDFPPRLSLQFEPGYRIERGRGTDRDVFGLRLDLRYVIAQLSMHLQVRHEWVSLDGGDVSQTLVSFSLRRRW